MLQAGGGENASATVIEVPLVPALPVRHTDTGPTLPAVTRRLTPGSAQAERRGCGMRRCSGRAERGVESVVRWKCPRRDRPQR